MYEQYENAMRKLNDELVTLNGFADFNGAEYYDAKVAAEKLAQEIKNTWDNFQSDELRGRIKESFSKEIVLALADSLNAYYADNDFTALQNQMKKIRKSLLEYKNQDSHEKPAKRKKTSSKQKEAPQEYQPVTKPQYSVQEYFRRQKLLEKLFPDKNGSELEKRLNKNIEMVVMLEPNQPEKQEYYKVYLFNVYCFQRRSSLLGNHVYYEHVYKPENLELVSDSPITEEIKSKVNAVFSSAASDNTNTYGLHIKISSDALTLELKRRGDMVSLNVSEQPGMAQAVHEIVIKPLSSTSKILKFEKILYFDTTSGQQNTSQNADIKCTVSVTLR